MIENRQPESNPYLNVLGNCGGYYSCPKDSNGKRLGPLVGYAGRYKGSDGNRLQWVGDVYANFAKIEMNSKQLRLVARDLAFKIGKTVGLNKSIAFCGAPIGGYSLATALGLTTDMDVIKAEKKIITLETPTSREKSELVFKRHEIVPGSSYVIVEDVCNNFSTTTELIYLIRSAGGEVSSIACFLNRSLAVGDVYSPGEIMLTSGQRLDWTGLKIPVISLVRLPIMEYKQDDPEVAEDVAAGNVIWDPKKKEDWARLMRAMGSPL